MADQSHGVDKPLCVYSSGGHELVNALGTLSVPRMEHRPLSGRGGVLSLQVTDLRGPCSLE